jgi:hypothetical protein
MGKLLGANFDSFLNTFDGSHIKNSYWLPFPRQKFWLEPGFSYW